MAASKPGKLIASYGKAGKGKQARPVAHETAGGWMNGVLRKVADLSAELSGLDVLYFGIGAEGEALVAAATPPDAATFQARWEQGADKPSFPKTRTDRGVDLIVVRADGRGAERMVVQGEVLAFPKVQVLPEGQLLVVGPRSMRSIDGSAELNGRIYASDGRLQREILLGDGIAHVQATATGRIWVGYFDEGVYGNFGWGRGANATPVGSAGLLRFDLTGRLEWRYSAPAGFGPIDDCYALNAVSDDEVWICYYSGFPLVRIGPADITIGWLTGLSGVSAIAVDGETVLFFGGYGADRYGCRIGRLRESAIDSFEDVQLEIEGGAAIEEARIASRGTSLHALAGRAWFRLELADLAG